ncbi:LysR family transcriptional regulator [Verminephrobacter aporrectodeae]|uniref:LysR family transcriptional regulator n=1 Tax=Verminephrobacter aporrectodeae TaxID=1110389 RepID=UPI000237545B|nr:LysR family transcriptional regulator [Verminephrobacter aporrectodeae]MCW5222154.1 LysR family transcriptional regulator [Verminephrobacter aporrectodeae subsp. tuberculatae]MCW5258481.1 LysR family transcriptional regulator [Verminephrobacter aporrectodeae subsp. tuberculatae]MCW5291445.1 LysR family transcriptional regulator [Verminephrobacter aporrectodeae subsp. tuberculatae]MCW8165081.1 LysR family transcriptional regulator [Verminephrobacter aporrectodeae subsp. tuberculatae]MCW81708
MKNTTLRQLRLFEAVASHLSYSRAAEHMGLTQPAVSMQLRQLEADLGLQLLVKIGKRIRLSQAGEEMLSQTRRILNQVHIAEEAVAAFRVTEGGGGLLHLGVVSTAHYFAPTLLMAFARQWPGVKFKLTVERREKILSLLQEHQIDVSIAGYPPSDADVEAETFAQNPHCIVAAAEHPLAKQRGIPWDALRDEPFIFREPGSTTRKFFEYLLQARALQVRVSMELSGNESIKQAVMAGMGISFLSAHTFQIELEAGRLAVLDLQDMPKMLDWCLLHRRESTLSGAAGAFRSFVLAHGPDLVQCRVHS